MNTYLYKKYCEIFGNVEEKHHLCGIKTTTNKQCLRLVISTES